MLAEINEEIRKSLKQYLPQYMIPENYIIIESLPLTVNGKVDYKKLPKVGLINQDIYIAPSTELEIQLCEIWQEVLKLDKVGVTDDFFRVGGNSILAIKLSNVINKNGLLSVSVADIFLRKTVSEMSQHIHILNTNIEQDGFEEEF